MTPRSSCPPSSPSLPANPSSMQRSSRCSWPPKRARRALRSPSLTPREQEVLAEIAQGKSNTAIAKSLVLSKRAVEKHIHSIFFKLGLSEAEDVSRRVKAALLFLAEEATDVARGAPQQGSTRALETGAALGFRTSPG